MRLLSCHQSDQLTVSLVTAVASAQASFIANAIYVAGSPCRSTAIASGPRRSKKISERDLQDTVIGTVLLQLPAALQGARKNIALAMTQKARNGRRSAASSTPSSTASSRQALTVDRSTFGPRAPGCHNRHLLRAANER